MGDHIFRPIYLSLSASVLVHVSDLVSVSVAGDPIVRDCVGAMGDHVFGSFWRWQNDGYEMSYGLPNGNELPSQRNENESQGYNV